MGDAIAVARAGAEAAGGLLAAGSAESSRLPVSAPGVVMSVRSRGAVVAVVEVEDAEPAAGRVAAAVVREAAR